MADLRPDGADNDTVYAVSKAGFRPFDCSRQAKRRETLAAAADAAKTPPSPEPKAEPAAIIDLGLERWRRDQGQNDPIL